MDGAAVYQITKITPKSKFLDYLQHGDCILADQEFTIAEELASCGAILKIQHFTKGKAQTSGKDVGTSRKISNVCMHLERVIVRLRKFGILQSNIPITQVKLLKDVMIIIAGLVDLNKCYFKVIIKNNMMSILRPHFITLVIILK